MKKYIPVLKRTKLFSGVGEDELEAMLSCLQARLCTYGKGEYVLRQGERVDNIFDFLDMEDDIRKGLLNGLSEKEIEDIVNYCNEYPDIEVKTHLPEEILHIEEDGSIEVELIGNEEDEGFNTQVTSSYYPQPLNATWWLILGDSSTNTIYSISEIDLERTNKRVLQFTAPSTPGHYKWSLYFMTDGYIGCDQVQDVEFDVVE